MCPLFERLLKRIIKVDRGFEGHAVLGFKNGRCGNWKANMSLAS